MRVTLSEWLGDAWVGFKNPHIAAIVSMVLTLGLVMSGTWIYLWQLFGASNQLMAALSLLIVTLWLKSSGRNPSYALYPMIFIDRKSTRLNSSHSQISYAVFCLKKKKT